MLKVVKQFASIIETHWNNRAIYIYATSSSPSSSHDISNEFVQPDPRQFPQAGMLSMLCFLHVHRRVLQSVRQLHLIIGSSFSGAGASAVCCGTNPSSHTAATPTLSGEVHQQIPSILGLAGTHAYCDIWLLLTLVVGSVDELELHLMRPSPGTLDAGGSPGCQSIFHCR